MVRREGAPGCGPPCCTSFEEEGWKGEGGVGREDEGRGKTGRRMEQCDMRRVQILRRRGPLENKEDGHRIRRYGDTGCWCAPL